MPQHLRQYWKPQKGRVTLNYNWDAINAGSVVHVTASEYVPENPNEHFAHTDYRRFVGAATITVSNVSPHGPPGDPNNGVTFVVRVDWDQPLPIVTDITVFDEKPHIEGE